MYKAAFHEEGQKYKIRINFKIAQLLEENFFVF